MPHNPSQLQDDDSYEELVNNITDKIVNKIYPSFNESMKITANSIPNNLENESEVRADVYLCVLASLIGSFIRSLAPNTPLEVQKKFAVEAALMATENVSGIETIYDKRNSKTKTTHYLNGKIVGSY